MPDRSVRIERLRVRLRGPVSLAPDALGYAIGVQLLEALSHGALVGPGGRGAAPAGLTAPPPLVVRMRAGDSAATVGAAAGAAATVGARCRAEPGPTP